MIDLTSEASISILRKQVDELKRAKNEFMEDFVSGGYFAGILGARRSTAQPGRDFIFINYLETSIEAEPRLVLTGNGPVFEFAWQSAHDDEKEKYGVIAKFYLLHDDDLGRFVLSTNPTLERMFRICDATDSQASKRIIILACKGAMNSPLMQPL